MLFQENSGVQFAIHAKHNDLLTRAFASYERRRRVFAYPLAVWRAFCVWSTPGTLNGVEEFLRQVVDEPDPMHRLALCEILKGSTRGSLVALAGSDPAAIERLDARTALEMRSKFAESTDTIPVHFVQALRHDHPHAVTVFTAGYSDAVIRCLEYAAQVEGTISFVQVVCSEPRGLRAAKRTMSELRDRGIGARLVPAAELRYRFTRQSVVVLGFEAVTPELEFIDPDHGIASFFDRGGLPLYLVGESWKVRDVTPEERLRYQNAIAVPQGSLAAAIAADRHGWRCGHEAVRECLLGASIGWRTSVRKSLKRPHLTHPALTVDTLSQPQCIILRFRQETSEHGRLVTLPS
jgi:hypothetical protein